MANVSKKGATVIGHLYGAPHNGAVRRFQHAAADSVALFVGDVVKLAGSASTLGDIPTIVQAAAGDVPLGIIVGFEPNYDNLTQLHNPASTLRNVLVNCDPNVLFTMQEDSVGGALAITDIGENVDIVVGSGSTVTGLSGMELDSSTHNTTSAQVRILGLDPTPGNALGVNAKFICMFNEHVYKSTTGS